MRAQVLAGVVASVMCVVSGCVGSGIERSVPAAITEDFIETPPAPDPDPAEQVEAKEVAYSSTSECVRGNWVVDNEAFAEFFVRQDDRVVSAVADGLATVTFDEAGYRMYFDDFDIRYTTGDPEFLLSRAGNETAEIIIESGDVLGVVARDDQITLGLFSLIGEEGDAIAMAVRDPGFFPFDGARLVCGERELEVHARGDVFVLNRL